jgi:nucleoid-associated protein YgaU
MPNDAKLGLVLGTGLVIIIAVVFFRRDSATAREGPEQPAAAAAVSPPGLLPTLAPRSRSAVPAKTAAGSQAAPARGMKHTVKEGETLFSLAQRYYKDGGRFVEIYRANQEALREPDRLEPGTVLVIPEAAE